MYWLDKSKHDEYGAATTGGDDHISSEHLKTLSVYFVFDLLKLLN